MTMLLNLTAQEYVQEVSPSWNAQLCFKKKKEKRKLKDKGSPQGARFAAGVSPRVCAASTGSSSSFPIRSLRQIVVAFHPVQDRFGFLDTVSAIGQFLSWRSVT